ncbi:MAG: hypothetical protein JWN00_1842, partial [Actinomycetia bacterium]|nr:hypothetical protein [Actinomycetes bacterium]
MSIRRSLRLGALVASGGVLCMGAAHDAGDVRLATSIALIGQTVSGTDSLATYAVTVRSDGGTAHGTELEVTTRRPAEWTDYAASCHQTLGIDDGADSRLICRLGDVAGPSSVRLTVRSPGRDS